MAAKQNAKVLPRQGSLGWHVLDLVRLIRRPQGKMPTLLLLNLLILLVFGLIILFSASYVTGYYRFGDVYHYIRPQAILAVGGVGIMLVVSKLDYHIYRRFTLIIYGVTVLLMVAALFCDPISGCRRWIHGDNLPFTLQPSEFAKVAIMLGVAAIYQAKRNELKKYSYGILYPVVLVAGPMVLLLLAQSHKSGMIIVLCIVFTMIAVGGADIFQLIFTAVGGVVCVVAYLMTQEDYVETRLATWSFNLDWDVLHYQTKQSILAIASGRLGGVGIGNGKQKQLWLPESVNDFIFAVLCEELGFIGAVICIGLFAWLIIQSLMIAIQAPDIYGVVLATGITAQIAWQVIFNLFVVTSIGPNTGISLPFFSDGGTSLVLLLGEMGILLNIGRAGNQAQERARREAQIHRELQPENQIQ